MKIEKLKQLIQIVELLEGDANLDPEFAIVVLDRGFVYVGDLTIYKGGYILNDASNIRVWGTIKGLGELVLEGPKQNTKLDACGVVKIPFKSVISIHPTKRELWTKS